MIYDIEIPINQFVLLLSPSFSWFVLVPVSAALGVGDAIKYLEVDSNNVVTGRSLIGIVDSVSTGDITVNNRGDLYIYCYNVSRPLGSAVVGSSFVVV